MALVFSACSKGDPSGATSVYVTIDNGQDLSAPDELRVTVLGAAARSSRISACRRPALWSRRRGVARCSVRSPCTSAAAARARSTSR